MSVCLLVFASSKASDYLPITLDRLKQFFPKVKSYLGIDSYETGNTMKQYYNFDDIITYNMNDKWSKKVHDLLLRIEEQYIFFLIDNNIFVDHFSEDNIKSYINLMQKYNIDQLRMLPSEVSSDIIIRNNEGIYKNHNINYSFSQQPAIWNKVTLENIIKKYITIDYRDFELTASKYASQFNNYFIYAEKDFIENQHNFSYGCPVFHALTYGKWVNESKLFIKLLDDIKNEYKIDLNKRGFFF
jgi:hypothetical protein